MNKPSSQVSPLMSETEREGEASLSTVRQSHDQPTCAKEIVAMTHIHVSKTSIDPWRRLQGGENINPHLNAVPTKTDPTKTPLGICGMHKQNMHGRIAFGSSFENKVGGAQLILDGKQGVPPSKRENLDLPFEDDIFNTSILDEINDIVDVLSPEVRGSETLSKTPFAATASLLEEESLEVLVSGHDFDSCDLSSWLEDNAQSFHLTLHAEHPPHDESIMSWVDINDQYRPGWLNEREAAVFNDKEWLGTNMETENSIILNQSIDSHGNTPLFAIDGAQPIAAICQFMVLSLQGDDIISLDSCRLDVGLGQPSTGGSCDEASRGSVSNGCVLSFVGQEALATRYIGIEAALNLQEAVGASKALPASKVRYLKVIIAAIFPSALPSSSLRRKQKRWMS